MAASIATHTRATTTSAARAGRPVARAGAAAGPAWGVLSTLAVGSSVEGSTVARGLVRLVGVATGYGAAAIAMPIAALEGSPSAWAVGRAFIAAVVAAAVAVGTSGRRPRGWALAGPAVALAAAVLLDVSAAGVITIVLGALA